MRSVEFVHSHFDGCQREKEQIGRHYFSPQVLALLEQTSGGGGPVSIFQTSAAFRAW